jgi:hypothetical protein
MENEKKNVLCVIALVSPDLKGLSLNLGVK